MRSAVAERLAADTHDSPADCACGGNIRLCVIRHLFHQFGRLRDPQIDCSGATLILRRTFKLWSGYRQRFVSVRKKLRGSGGSTVPSTRGLIGVDAHLQ